jgi:hypothetical protein
MGEGPPGVDFSRYEEFLYSRLVPDLEGVLAARDKIYEDVSE